MGLKKKEMTIHRNKTDELKEENKEELEDLNSSLLSMMKS